MRLAKGCNNFVLKFGLEILTRYREIKVRTFDIGYFNERGWEFRKGTGSAGHFRWLVYNFVAWEQQIIMLKTGSKLIKK